MFICDTIDPEESRRYPKVTPQKSVLDVARAMAEGRVGAALIYDGAALSGIFTERDLILRVLGKGKSLTETTVGEVMTTALDIHEMDAPLFPALEKMTVKHYRHALVRAGDSDTVRVTTQKDIIRYCWGRLSKRQKRALQKKYLAADITQRYNDDTHRNLINVSASAETAIVHMMEKRTGSLLVVHEERLCGIFTERDVLMRVVACGLSPRNARLVNVSTLTPNVITPEVNIAIIMRLLLEKHYRRIPVTLMGKPLGMVTQRNIAHLLRDEYGNLFRGTAWSI